MDINIPKMLIILICLWFKIEKEIMIGILNAPNKICLKVK